MALQRQPLPQILLVRDTMVSGPYHSPLSPHSLPMTAALLYILTFTSWGLGLLAAFVALSMKMQEHAEKVKSMKIKNEARSLELIGKRGLASALLTRISNIKTPDPKPEIPEELQKLMDRSPSHPEVTEIEPGDEVFGVLFKGQDYPPPMEQETEE